jgi:F-type H+-transporting ATPase subunit epsilon
VEHPPFHLDFVTPGRVLFSGSVSSFSAPGVLGGFQVLKNHAPLLALMTVGELKITDGDGKEYRFATTGGVVDVRQNKAVILAEVAERTDEIDIERATRAMERARERLVRREAGVDGERARRALQRALNRLRVAGRPPGS